MQYCMNETHRCVTLLFSVGPLHGAPQAVAHVPVKSPGVGPWWVTRTILNSDCWSCTCWGGGGGGLWSHAAEVAERWVTMEIPPIPCAEAFLLYDYENKIMVMNPQNSTKYLKGTFWLAENKRPETPLPCPRITVYRDTIFITHPHVIPLGLAARPVGEAPRGPVSPAPVPPGVHTLASGPDWLRWHVGLSPLIQEGVQSLRVYRDQTELVLKRDQFKTSISWSSGSTFWHAFKMQNSA